MPRNPIDRIVAVRPCDRDLQDDGLIVTHRCDADFTGATSQNRRFVDSFGISTVIRTERLVWGLARHFLNTFDGPEFKRIVLTG
jgi:hypothetical protein